MANHLFTGYFLVALYQGVAAYILFSIFRIRGALLFAVLSVLCSFIPLIGAATIWIPVGILKMTTTSIWSGIFLLCLSAVFITAVEIILRPMILKDRMKLHPLLIFFAILGGLEFFGINGLVIGPAIIMLFFAVLDVFKDAYSINEPPLECNDEKAD